jgi:hypothetical protein
MFEISDFHRALTRNVNHHSLYSQHLKNGTVWLDRIQFYASPGHSKTGQKGPVLEWSLA